MPAAFAIFVLRRCVNQIHMLNIYSLYHTLLNHIQANIIVLSTTHDTQFLTIDQNFGFQACSVEDCKDAYAFCHTLAPTRSKDDAFAKVCVRVPVIM